MIVLPKRFTKETILMIRGGAVCHNKQRLPIIFLSY